jgi:hypothetical protein
LSRSARETASSSACSSEFFLAAKGFLPLSIMETVAQGVNWHSASAFLKQKTNSTGQPPAKPLIFRTEKAGISGF